MTVEPSLRALAKPKEFLGLAPEFGSTAASDSIPRGLESLAPIPGALSEVRLAGAALGASGDSILTASLASESRLRDLSASGKLASYGIIVFSTHALVADDFAGAIIEPSLVLNRTGDSSEQDGILTASEIAQLRFGRALVILSACNTAAGRRSAGDGLSGLARAFILAGAQSLIVSHWRVRDDVAKSITVSVSQASNISDPAISLRRAMQSILEDRSADEEERPMSHPALWAPFILLNAD